MGLKTRSTTLRSETVWAISHFFMLELGMIFSFQQPLKASCPILRVPTKLNRLSLAVHLSHRWFDNTQTFYDSITRLPAGHYLCYKKRYLSVTRYWNPIPENGRIDWLGEEAFEEFSKLFESTISNYLSIGRPGMFLSGGLDSVSVAAVATDECKSLKREAPLALSLGFEAQGVDETIKQKGVAQQLGLSQVFMPLSEAVQDQGILQATLNLSPYLSAPVQNPWIGGYHPLGLKGKSLGCDFIMTGGGGDEWLTVDPYYAYDLMRSFNLKGLLHLTESISNSYHLSQAAMLKNVLWQSGLRKIISRSIRNTASNFPITQTLVRERDLKSALNKLPKWIAPEPRLRSQLQETIRMVAEKNLRPKHTSLYLETMDRSLNHPLMAMDIEEEFHRSKHMGLLMLSAFWNADLIEMLYRVPPHLLNAGKKSKGLVRYTLAKRFPTLHFEKQKKVVSIDFFKHVLLTEGKEVFNKVKGFSSLYDLGIVHPSQTPQLINSIISTNDSHQAYRLWDLLSLESWVRVQKGG